MDDGLKVGCVIVVAVLFISMCLIGGCVTGIISPWVNEAAQVARQELGAVALLKKYQWFKDASAQLDKKLADIKVYESRFAALKEAYGDEPRSKWAREDREQFNIWSSEVAGVKASYNSLASEYNSAMAKINWQFAEVGHLPLGADKPLPREYKPYVYD